jgi:hypothetical protein
MLSWPNLSTTTLAEVADTTEQGIQRVCRREDLVVRVLATPASPSTHEPSIQPTKLNKRAFPAAA